MPVRTRAQARRRGRRSALLIGSDYRGRNIEPSKFGVTDVCIVKKCLLEHGRYEEKMLNSLQLECFLIPEFSPEFNIFFFVLVTPCSSLSRVTRPCGQNQALFWDPIRMGN
ncbi:hypothetical protein QL285_000349 [Trifolium repens]|nr:hypothetical protein QL285_000349 [Trifolium repens]